MKPNLILDGHKLAWHSDRVNALLSGERVAPITIDCALTRRCNYRCEYCYGRLQDNDEKKMTRRVILDFLDDAAEIGVKGISFVSDGESTCSPHLHVAVTHGAENGLSMALGTNGYLLNRDRFPELLAALTYLRFNISAGEPERYAAIHGVRKDAFLRVCDNIRAAVAVKKKLQLDVTIGLQMVLMPAFADQIRPLALLGRDLGVDYLVIKHCSDDESGSLGVDYDQYFLLTQKLEDAEKLSTDHYLVQAKWSKIMSGGKRSYQRCFGPALMMQFSGSGLVAPCGMLFNSKYRKYHIGNIAETRFKDIWQSDRYWEILRFLGSSQFNAQTMCGTLCLQHKVNECLWDLKNRRQTMPIGTGIKPKHINFI